MGRVDKQNRTIAFVETQERPIATASRVTLSIHWEKSGHIYELETEFEVGNQTIGIPVSEVTCDKEEKGQESFIRIKQWNGIENLLYVCNKDTLAKRFPFVG